MESMNSGILPINVLVIDIGGRENCRKLSASCSRIGSFSTYILANMKSCAKADICNLVSFNEKI